MLQEIPNPKSQAPNPNVWDLGFGLWDLGFSLVRQAEAELHRSIRAVDVLQELRDGRLVLADGPVRTVEHVEHVRDQIERAAAADADLLLQPDVRAVLRRRDEPGLRDDRAVRADALIEA